MRIAPRDVEPDGDPIHIHGPAGRRAGLGVEGAGVWSRERPAAIGTAAVIDGDERLVGELRRTRSGRPGGRDGADLRRACRAQQLALDVEETLERITRQMRTIYTAATLEAAETAFTSSPRTGVTRIPQ